MFPILWGLLQSIVFTVFSNAGGVGLSKKKTPIRCSRQSWFCAVSSRPRNLWERHFHFDLHFHLLLRFHLTFTFISRSSVAARMSKGTGLFYWATSGKLFLYWPVSRCAFGRESKSPDPPLPGWEATGRHSWAGVGEEGPKFCAAYWGSWCWSTFTFTFVRPSQRLRSCKGHGETRLLYITTNQSRLGRSVRKIPQRWTTRILHL